MNFIESIFRISPDHGSGLLEAGILLVVLAIPMAAAAVRMILRHRAFRAS